MNAFDIPEKTAEAAKPTIASPVRKRHSWIKTLFLASVVFLAGGVAGGAGTLMFIHRHLSDFIRHPADAPLKIIPILKRRLRLDEEQTVKVEAIVREHHLNLQEIRNETTPRVRAEIDAIKTEVSEILTAQQRELWDRRITQLTDFWFPTSASIPPDELEQKPDAGN